MNAAEYATKFAKKFDGAILSVVKVSVMWSEEAEAALRKEDDFAVIEGAVDKASATTVVALGDGIVVELYP